MVRYLCAVEQLTLFRWMVVREIEYDLIQLYN